jgi:nucleotide-binding universal stress UspA family protein
MITDASSFPELTASVQVALEQECAALVAAHPGVAVTYHAVLGPAATVLTQMSAQARMLVVGSRGRGGISGLLLGSVADRCLHQTLCPLLIVHPEATAEVAQKPKARDADHAPVSRPALEIRAGSVVVGHDGSADSDRAAAAGFVLAEALRVPLAIIRCWTFEHMPHGLLWRDGYVVSIEEASATVTEQLTSDLAHRASQHPDVSVGYYGTHGEPRELLVAASAEAAMLVLGNRGRGGFRSLLLGSVSGHCAHRAVCPTLIIRRAEHAAEGLQ